MSGGDLTDALEAHMENLFGWICQQQDQEKAVESLEDYALRDLNGWLARLNVPNGIPGLIHGLVLVEAAERFMRQRQGGEA
jgi:hypothetical protein